MLLCDIFALVLKYYIGYNITLHISINGVMLRSYERLYRDIGSCMGTIR